MLLFSFVLLLAVLLFDSAGERRTVGSCFLDQGERFGPVFRYPIALQVGPAEFAGYVGFDVVLAVVAPNVALRFQGFGAAPTIIAPEQAPGIGLARWAPIATPADAALM